MEKCKELLKMAKNGQIKLSEMFAEMANETRTLEIQEDSMGANRSARATQELMSILSLFEKED